MAHSLKSLKEFILDCLFPSYCINCGTLLRENEVLCKTCFASIIKYNTFFCGACRARLPTGNKTCHKNTPYLLGAASSYHDPAVKALVIALKFRGMKKAALPLSALMTDYYSTLRNGGEDAILIPIPLGKRRERERGFNQSLLLTRLIAEKLNLPLTEGNLIRTRETKPQSELGDVKERGENVAGCFALRNPEEIRRKDIVLIDDVVTSGATMEEAARTLRKGGARTVLGLAAAKA